MKISPNDILPNGTAVKVQSKLGNVVSCEIKRDQFGIPISVHTVQFTQRFSHKTAGLAIYKPMNETRTVNYSFIETI